MVSWKKIELKEHWTGQIIECRMHHPQSYPFFMGAIKHQDMGGLSLLYFTYKFIDEGIAMFHCQRVAIQMTIIDVHPQLPPWHFPFQNADRSWYVNGGIAILRFVVWGCILCIFLVHLSFFLLVGGIPTPLKNMWKSVGMMKFPIYGKKMFQTTNQSSIKNLSAKAMANLWYPTKSSQCLTDWPFVAKIVKQEIQ